MKNIFKSITAIALAILVSVSITQAVGTLTPTETEGEDTQYTLNDIYNKLIDFTAEADEGMGLFETPGTVSATFNTLSEIYALLEAQDLNLVPENIRDNVTIFGIEGELEEVEKGLSKTGQTTSYVANDDGDLEFGLHIDYTDNEDGTVTDNVTGLIWQQDGGQYADSWADALVYCSNNIAELPGVGWRLPNFKELISIVDIGRSPAINPVFDNIGPSFTFWTSSTPSQLITHAFVITFVNTTFTTIERKDIDEFQILCVR
jgi:hypothetical protein